MKLWSVASAIYDLLQAGRSAECPLAYPTPIKIQPHRWSNLLGHHNQTIIGWHQALSEHLSSQLELAMTTYMHHCHPHQLFQPENWTRTILCWLENTNTVNCHYTTLTSIVSTKLHLKYFTDSPLLKKYLKHPTKYHQFQPTRTSSPSTFYLQGDTSNQLLSSMHASFPVLGWATQVTNILKQEHCIHGTITKLLIAHTTRRWPSESPD